MNAAYFPQTKNRTMSKKELSDRLVDISNQLVRLNKEVETISDELLLQHFIDDEKAPRPKDFLTGA